MPEIASDERNESYRRHESFQYFRYRLRPESKALYLERFVLKRSFDNTLAGLLLILALPVLIIAVGLIKLESREPAFFCQLRMGRGFKVFKLLKLRTMRGCCGGPAYTLGADARITRSGRWLRRFKIDELPQLWNVLCGDMSLVGPRPVIPELILEFRSGYDRLLAVRPGLTDPATVKYCREAEILDQVPDPEGYFKAVMMPDKLRISDAYLQRATAWSDLVVLACTFAALLPSSDRAQAMERGLAAAQGKTLTLAKERRGR
jgi:lipopolysaccharide/colanic/teichoic acid biosynthesis glycosyltransferase